MDGTRNRLIALAAPVVVGLALALAALVAAAGAGDVGSRSVLPQTTLGGPHTLPDPEPSHLTVPETTPPSRPAVEASTGVGPVPDPEPAQTAARPDDRG